MINEIERRIYSDALNGTFDKQVCIVNKEMLSAYHHNLSLSASMRLFSHTENVTAGQMNKNG